MKLRRPPSVHSCCCPIWRANIRRYFSLFRCIERRPTKFVLCRHRRHDYAPRDRRICSRLKNNTVTITLNFLGCTHLWLGQCMTWFIPVHRKENYCKESAVTDLSLFFLCRAKSSHNHVLLAVLSSNEVDLLRYSTWVEFLVSTFYKVNLYTVLSTCNEVTFFLQISTFYFVTLFATMSLPK